MLSLLLKGLKWLEGRFFILQFQSPTMIDVDMMLGQLESGDVSTARPMQTPDHIMVVAETAFLSGSESEQEYITAVHTRIGSGLW